ncbi:MAG: DsbA family protein [Pseudomonadota bacterium]
MNRISRRLVLGATSAFFAFPVFAQSIVNEDGLVDDIVLGNPDAAVTIIEYASFTCPHCKRFHEGPFKQLKEEYIDTGKVKFIYREVFFDREGLWASMLARCAGPEKYMGIADMIYTEQRNWPVRDNPAQTEANLKKMGLVAGMEQETIDACFQDRALAQALVTTYQNNASQDGVNSTPTFIINGRQYGNMPYGELSQIIERRL